MRWFAAWWQGRHGKRARWRSVDQQAAPGVVLGHVHQVVRGDQVAELPTEELSIFHAELKRDHAADVAED